MVYYDLGFISIALAIGSISYDNIVLTKFAEIWKHGDIIKMMFNGSRNTSSLTIGEVGNKCIWRRK